MKTKVIDHPLRQISYQYRENHFQLNHEIQSLDNYRLAHDRAWRMKQLFERETGECQLALIELLLLEDQRIEYKEMLDFYKKDVDLSKDKPYLEIEPNFQVELRNYYNSVIELHHKLIRFYDRIGSLEKEYIVITDTYFRGEKPIDPLNFKVLESIFEHYEDMQTDIVSLDKDLQEFLVKLTKIYDLLDKYTIHYGKLYATYGTVLKQTAQLVQDIQVLGKIWGEGEGDFWRNSL